MLHAAPQGGVVVAADSRTSTGSYIANRTSDKLTPVAERAAFPPLPLPFARARTAGARDLPRRRALTVQSALSCVVLSRYLHLPLWVGR